MAIHVVSNPAVRARRWFAALVVAVVVVAVAPQAFAGDDVAAPGVTDTYVVVQGETLWSIAGSITPPDKDVRDTVALIQSMNLLDSAAIRSGDQIVVPVFGA